MFIPLKEISLPTISSNHSCSGRSGASGAATTFVSLCAQQLCPVQKMWYLTVLLPILWSLHSFCPFSMTFLTLAWASFMCKCQLVPEKEQRQSGFWRPKFGTDTHHLCILLANTSKRTRWIQGGGGIKRRFLIGVVEKPRGIKSIPQSVVAGGMKDNGHFFFVNVDNYVFILFATFLLMLFWAEFILMAMHSCKGGLEACL